MLATIMDAMVVIGIMVIPTGTMDGAWVVKDATTIIQDTGAIATVAVIAPLGCGAICFVSTNSDYSGVVVRYL